MINLLRAAWADAAVAEFAKQVGMDRSGELAQEKDVVLGDLLCDIMHWCDVYKIDFAVVCRKAAEDYRYELQHDD
jgi:hypothetical protein